LTDEARPYRRRLLLNTASTTAGNVWAMVVALISLPLLLRGLGGSAFGLWVLVQTFSAVNGWLSLADIGLGTATIHAVATRAGSGDLEGASSVVRTSIALFMVTGTIAAISLMACSSWFPRWFHSPQALRSAFRTALVIFAVQIAFELVTEGIEACLEGFQRVDLSRLIDAVRRTLVAGATVTVALMGGGLVKVAWASLGATVLTVGVAFLAMRGQTAGGGFDRQAVAPLLAYARKVAAVDANGVVKRTMDRVIVGALLGPVAVALVEIATQVQNGANAILSASSYAAISSSAWLRARDQESSLRELLEKGTRYSLLVTWPIATLTALLAGPIVRIWVGDKYDRAAFLIVIALIPMVAAIWQVGSNMLRGGGRVSAIFRPALTSTAVNLVASVMLVKAFGVAGTFYGTLVGTTVLMPYLGRAVLREYHVGLSRFLSSTIWPALVPNLLLAIAVGAVVALPLGDAATLVAGVAVGGLVYLTAVVRWGLAAGEAAELRQTLRKGPAARNSRTGDPV
jgi:O-antigen/teichoic acid export membrane protein